jgi:hypothetical protein
MAPPLKMRDQREATAAAEKWGQLAKEFHGESDRGCAVLVLCVLEELLHGMIRCRVVDPADDSIRYLAPRGRLSVSVEVAVQLGLLNKRQAKSFLGLVKVRNKFAHGVMRGLTFDTPEIAALVRSIEPGSRYPRHRNFEDDLESDSIRMRFLGLAAVLVIWMTLVEPERLEAAPDPDPDAPRLGVPPIG